jgi:hypothetical protein
MKILRDRMLGRVMMVVWMVSCIPTEHHIQTTTRCLRKTLGDLASPVSRHNMCLGPEAVTTTPLILGRQAHTRQPVLGQVKILVASILQVLTAAVQIALGHLPPCKIVPLADIPPIQASHPYLSVQAAPCSLMEA